MNRFIYIEINNRTGEISNISPYKTDYYKNRPNKTDYYKNRPITDRLSSIDYTGFIINTFRYINKYRCSKPDQIPSNVHTFIINKNRRKKVLKIKEMINDKI